MEKKDYTQKFGEAVGTRIYHLHHNQVGDDYELIGLTNLGTCTDMNALDQKLDVQKNQGNRFGPPKAGKDLSVREQAHVSSLAGTFARAHNIPDPFGSQTQDMVKAGIVGVYAKIGANNLVTTDPAASLMH